ncbi:MULTISPECIES: hypothetical protein [unclassified Methanosarcina]|uniref:hypothetical protein n=1 Tax=unclassified Methanosarcina TaxID=2644672 RepID=UPI0012E03CBD|nr:MULTISPECIES: hypothetical protein [unclassified Methanosarcina]
MSIFEIDGVLWKSIDPYLPPHKPHTERPPSIRKLIDVPIKKGKHRLCGYKRVTGVKLSVLVDLEGIRYS